jgi:hypothetical protein
MLQPNRRSESEISRDWENISGEIIGDNLEKYKNELSKKEIMIVERIVSGEMTFLGYLKEYPGEMVKISKLDRIRSKIINRVIMKYKYGVLMRKKQPLEYNIRLKEKRYIKDVKSRMRKNTPQVI